MSRLLLLLAAGAAVYLLVRSFRRTLAGDKSAKPASPPAKGEDMVRCAHCGVHLPVSESVLSGGEYYCSEAHRLLHQDKTGGNGS